MSDNMMPGTWGGNDPANVLDWIDELADICNDCDKMSDVCECENPSGYHRDWVFRCPYCYSLLRNDSELEHECEVFYPDDDY